MLRGVEENLNMGLGSRVILEGSDYKRNKSITIIIIKDLSY
jgi:hypothetical protein